MEDHPCDSVKLEAHNYLDEYYQYTRSLKTVFFKCSNNTVIQKKDLSNPEDRAALGKHKKNK